MAFVSRNKMLELSASALIVLFIYSSVSKLLVFKTFSSQLGQSPFITSYATVLAWALPLFELLVSVMLINPKWRLAGFYFSLFLMSLFTYYLVAMLNYGGHIPCSCGGVLGMMSWTTHIYFNLLFVLMSLLSIIYYPVSKPEAKQIRYGISS